MSIRRFGNDELLDTLEWSRVTEILGARQVGKTTLAKDIARQKDGMYVTLDDSLQREFAKSDVQAFVSQNEGKLLVIDEVQLVPDIIPELKRVVDMNPVPGKFLITGSADLSNISSIHESLAGRASIVEVYGLSQDELLGRKSFFLEDVFGGQINDNYTSDLSKDDYIGICKKGAYPEIHISKNLNREKWYRNYLKLIFNRDAKDISSLRQISILPTIIKYLSSIAGHELVINNLSREINVPRSTLDPYVELLETLFLVKRLDAWSGNLTSRVISNKKAFVIDSGIATYLQRNISDWGGIFEMFITSELMRHLNYREGYKMYHYRDYSRREVDIILENASNEIVPIEVKLTSTPNYSDIRVIKEFSEKYGKKMKAGIVIYTGKKVEKVGKNLFFIPASMIWGG